MAINKEIDLRFVLGYTPLEFRDTLRMLAEGEVDPPADDHGHASASAASMPRSPRSADPEPHAKILIDPASDTLAPVATTAA